MTKSLNLAKPRSFVCLERFKQNSISLFKKTYSRRIGVHLDAIPPQLGAQTKPQARSCETPEGRSLAGYGRFTTENDTECK